MYLRPVATHRGLLFVYSVSNKLSSGGNPVSPGGESQLVPGDFDDVGTDFCCGPDRNEWAAVLGP